MDHSSDRRAEPRRGGLISLIMRLSGGSEHVTPPTGDHPEWGTGRRRRAPSPPTHSAGWSRLPSRPGWTGSSARQRKPSWNGIGRTRSAQNFGLVEAPRTSKRAVAPGSEPQQTETQRH